MFNWLKRKKESTNTSTIEKSCSVNCSNSEDFSNLKDLFINKTSSEVRHELEDEIVKYKEMGKKETNSYERAYNEGYIDALTKATILVSFIKEN